MSLRLGFGFILLGIFWASIIGLCLLPNMRRFQTFWYYFSPWGCVHFFQSVFSSVLRLTISIGLSSSSLTLYSVISILLLGALHYLYFSVLKFLFASFFIGSSSFLKLFPFVWRMIVCTSKSIFIIAIFILLVLASFDYLFTVSWNFPDSSCQVILDYILDILNIMLSDSVSCLNPMENINFFFKAGNQPSWVKATNFK